MYDAKDGMNSTASWTATGHDAILAGYKADMNSGGTLTSLNCDHSNKTGAINVSDGTWAMTAKGPDGKDASVRGDWVTVSEIRDGKSVILVQLINMQLPHPPMK